MVIGLALKVPEWETAGCIPGTKTAITSADWRQRQQGSAADDLTGRCQIWPYPEQFPCTAERKT